MIDYNENMGCSKEEYDRMNELVEKINKLLGQGRSVFRLESTTDYENECVDIYENGIATYTYMTFEDAVIYLGGIAKGVLMVMKYN